MRLFVVFVLSLLFGVCAHAQVKHVPKDLSEAEVEAHQAELVLLNEIYKNRNRLSAPDQKPSGRAMNYSRSILQDASEEAMNWLKEKGYVTTSVYHDKVMDKLYPLVHLNPEIKWQTLTDSPTPVEYTVSTGLSKAGYHKRKAWTMQAAAMGVAFVGGMITYGFATDGRSRVARFFAFGSLVAITGLEGAFISHKIKEGRALEAIPGGARFRF